MKERGDDFGYQKDSEVMKQYYRDIKQIKVLSAEEQIELAIKAQAGDQKAKQDLCTCNLRFIVTIAKEYLHSGLPLPDLVNEGTIGMMQAVDRFDPDRGIRFISYAVWWVRQAIQKTVYEQERNVRLPINKINAINKVTKAKERLFQELGRDPSNEEIVKFVDGDVSENDIRSISINGNFEVSIDQRFDDTSDTSIGDLLAGDSYEDMQDEMNETSLRNEIMDILEGLDERSSKIICMYFGINGYNPMTLNEIGAKLNLTNERVRQIKKDSLRQLRNFDNSEKLRDFITLK